MSRLSHYGAEACKGVDVVSIFSRSHCQLATLQPAYAQFFTAMLSTACTKSTIVHSTPNHYIHESINRRQQSTADD